MSYTRPAIFTWIAATSTNGLTRTHAAAADSFFASSRRSSFSTWLAATWTWASAVASAGVLANPLADGPLPSCFLALAPAPAAETWTGPVPWTRACAAWSASTSSAPSPPPSVALGVGAAGALLVLGDVGQLVGEQLLAGVRLVLAAGEVDVVTLGHGAGVHRAGLVVGGRALVELDVGRIRPHPLAEVVGLVSGQARGRVVVTHLVAPLGPAITRPLDSYSARAAASR